MASISPRSPLPNRELIGITAVECQQRGGTGGQGRALQPFREFLHCKDGIPVFGQSFYLGMKALAASDSMIAEDEDVCPSEGSRQLSDGT